MDQITDAFSQGIYTLRYFCWPLTFDAISQKSLLEKLKAYGIQSEKLKWFRSRHFSHVTKSGIFKTLYLRKKADRNFRCTFLKNRFRQLKLYSNPPSWLARSGCHIGTFWKTKDSSLYFWGSQPFRPWKVEFHGQRRLKWRKQVFLLNFRLWTTQKPTMWSIFYGK